MMTNKQFFAYSASAGSGKTYALALRYIALLFLEQNPSEILAATFTKKAANEMKQRVLKLLKNLDKEQGFVDSLVSEYGLKREFILKNQPKILSRFLKSQNHIVTLDSFFSSILRSCALHIGLEPDFSIKDRGQKALNEEFLIDLERYGEMQSLVKLSINLNKRKSEDVVELLNSLYQIDSLLPEAEYRVHNLEPIAREIEALRVQLLELVQNVGASASAIKNFEECEIKEFIKKGVFDKESLSEHRFYKKYIEKEPQIDTLFLELKAKIATYHKELEGTILHYLFKIFDRYKNVRIEQIRAKSELNFNDILYFTHRLLSSEITKEFLYFKLDTKFKHILLDEFQDTSALQYLILKPLIDEIFAGVGQSDFRTFFYVGDVKQSLYRFRGGVEELFEYIANEYGIEVATLDTNYRSARLIVEKTNSWFKGKIPNFVEQKAKSETAGFVQVLRSEEPKQVAKEKVEFLLNSGVALEDIAILLFANKDGIAMQEYLKSFGIDSQLKTSSSLRFNQKIAALVGVLEYLVYGEEIYIEPFKQKLGLERVDFSWFKSYLSPFDALERIVKEYSYFGGDLNILKLLDFAKGFSTIESFLDEFSTSNIELAKESKGGLQIMTIHGSKGLEFKHVIVADRFGGRPPSRDMLLFKNSTPIKIDKVFYKHSKKENFIPQYATALQKEKELQDKDKLNLLYVALTRAELSMIVVQKDKSSEFKALELEEATYGKIEPELKEPKAELAPLATTISSYGRQEVESVETEDSELMDYNALNFGEALHYCLEMLDFKNPASINVAIQAVTNRYGSKLEPWQIKSIEKRANNLLTNQEFYGLIDGTKLLKEQPIVYKEKFYQLDLLAKGENKNIIFDYKSSKNFAKKHTEQVANYVEALKSIAAKECEGYILYMLESGVEIAKV